MSSESVTLAMASRFPGGHANEDFAARAGEVPRSSATENRMRKNRGMTSRAKPLELTQRGSVIAPTWRGMGA
jgi:hypothetical protein